MLFRGLKLEQLLDTWNALDLRRRILLVGSTVIMLLGLIGISRMASQPDYALLYSNLSSSAAGDVISALDAQGAMYDIRGNAIYVSAGQRDELRLRLAGEGLPASGTEGYEILDSLTGFGTTSQMFDAAYVRAKEGELARTILANPQIKAARVHIAKGQRNVFRQVSETTASVSLRAGPGGIDVATGDAIRHLVAAAVRGLVPQNVAIIDAENGMVLRDPTENEPGEAAHARAESLKRNIERLLAARVGPGNAVVEVNVETFTEEEVIVERRFDPEGRVAISTETQETSNSATNSGGGDVTVASNLPTGEGGGAENSSSQNNDTREIVNYEVSETTRELRKAPGSIKRVTVAVLVDGTSTIDDSGAEIFEPRSEEEIQVFEDLVKSAVGFNEARGDSVTVRTLDLAETPQSEELLSGGPSFLDRLDLGALSRIGVTGLLMLLIGLFVLRPILTSASGNAPLAITADNSAGELATGAIGGEIDVATDMPPPMGNALDGP